VSTFELAQLNLAQMRTPMDSPEMADFVANLDRINALAEGSPGFVWRLQGEDGKATALRPLGENMLVNISVWRDVAALRDYVYQTGHVEIMRRRREWFDQIHQASLVLWWVPAGHRPDEFEAAEKLALLCAQGPSPGAFSFRHSYAAPDAESSVSPTSSTISP
jgi:hypothetical protein